MKNKIWSTIAIAAAMLCSSCENDFDPNLYGSLNPDNFPSNEAEYTSYMMTCYMPFMTVWTYDMSAGGVQHGWYIPAGGVIRMFDCPSDFMAAGNLNEEGWAYFTRGQFAPAVYYWRGQVQDVHNVNHFPKTTQITRFTEIIGTLEDAPADRLEESKKMSLLGEARLCRGIMLYYLLHTFGPVPVVIDPEKVLDPEALSNTSRPSLDQMCQWIADDFEFAVANAPETAPDLGRYTRDYARFCLMRHCLNEGSHMSGYYQRGIEMYNELNTGKYQLYTEGSNPYKSVFSYYNKFNCEIIAAVSCNDGADGYPQHGNFWPLLALSLPWNVAREDPFPTETRWLQAYSMNVNYYDAFEPNDQRRDCILTSYKANNGQTYNRSNIGSQWNGFIINKWPHECDAQFQSQDVPLARWADVLLMYAELLVRKNNTVSTEAIDAVNTVRKRAGLNDLSSYACENVDNFLYVILVERGHELMFEGCRKIDLIRFNRFAREMYKYKNLVPDYQYVPIPNYAVQQSAEAGHPLTQYYSRPGWNEDKGGISDI